MIIENLRYAWSSFSKAKESETMSCDFLSFQRDKAIPHRVSTRCVWWSSKGHGLGVWPSQGAGAESPPVIQGEGREGLADLWVRGVEVGLLGFAVVRWARALFALLQSPTGSSKEIRSHLNWIFSQYISICTILPMFGNLLIGNRMSSVN